MSDDTLHVSLNLLRQDIKIQLDAAQAIFNLIQELHDVATNGDNPSLKDALESIMQRLLDVGDHLSHNANDIANDIGAKLIDSIERSKA